MYNAKQINTSGVVKRDSGVLHTSSYLQNTSAVKSTRSMSVPMTPILKQNSSRRYTMDHQKSNILNGSSTNSPTLAEVNRQHSNDGPVRRRQCSISFNERTIVKGTEGSCHSFQKNALGDSLSSFGIDTYFPHDSNRNSGSKSIKNSAVRAEMARKLTARNSAQYTALANPLDTSKTSLNHSLTDTSLLGNDDDFVVSSGTRRLKM
ncbi:hypothetical protein AGDE_17208 [Angomonas deanei]|uniref:Uncharacterized protein n=1 Tax=Angomonas deanei TaxID=59799 RepID=A0A7G2C6P1_9TRYP|nr:hypothetical protein AGDE_17208 [Angomonas deanei]CAD2213632.1 hypothetical protein, conserved [Angomonas deanei]|eukprot:EPY15039.1 hypothetical protein AGDE_17208 [Angomonas deanei]